MHHISIVCTGSSSQRDEHAGREYSWESSGIATLSISERKHRQVSPLLPSGGGRRSFLRLPLPYRAAIDEQVLVVSIGSRKYFLRHVNDTSQTALPLEIPKPGRYSSIIEPSLRDACRIGGQSSQPCIHRCVGQRERRRVGCWRQRNRNKSRPG